MSYVGAILHLSDIECGEKSRMQSASVVNAADKCADRLVEDVHAELVDKRDVPSNGLGLVVTGDTVDKGGARDGEYDEAASIIERIRDRLSISEDLVAIVPGNHDVNWETVRLARQVPRGSKGPSDQDSREWLREHRSKFEGFRGFLERITGIRDYMPERVVPYPGFRRLGFAVVGFDTTFPCTCCPEDNYGMLRDDQVTRGKEALAGLRAEVRGLVPLALLHHCPIPRHDDPRESSYLREASQALEWLRSAGFYAVMCGHEHSTRVTIDGRRLNQVFTGGSFGLGVAGLTDRYGDRVESNKYQILLVRDDGSHELLFRRLDPMGRIEGKWVCDDEGGDGSQTVHLHRREGSQDNTALTNLIRPLISDPRLLRGRERCLLAIAVGAGDETLARLRRVVYCFDDYQVTSDIRDQQFLAHAELAADGPRTVEIRVLPEGGEIQSIGHFPIPPPRDLLE